MDCAVNPEPTSASTTSDELNSAAPKASQATVNADADGDADDDANSTANEARIKTEQAQRPHCRPRAHKDHNADRALMQPPMPIQLSRVRAALL